MYGAGFSKRGRLTLFRQFMLLSLVIGTFVFLGCKHESLPEKAKADEGGSERVAVSPEHAKLLKNIVHQQENTGKALEDLAKQLARERAAAKRALEGSTLKRDFAAARALLVATRRAVHSEKPRKALKKLERLQRLVRLMQTEVPAGEILAHLQRAAHALSGSSVGVQADVASMELLAALDVALKHKDAPIVPNLARELEGTKEQVDEGNYDAALSSIDEYISTVSEHESLITLDRMAEGIRGAREAMERNASVVVIAELDQLSELANDFSRMLKSAPSLAKVEEPAASSSGEAGEAEKEADVAEEAGEQAENEAGEGAAAEPPSSSSSSSTGGGEVSPPEAE